MRSLALFLAVGFFSSAVFLAVPEEVSRIRSFEAPEARENRTAGAVLLAGAGSIGGDGASCAPALARKIRPRRYDEVVKEELILEVVREDGRPIAGATVFGIHEGIPLEALTDEAGRATLRTFHEVETEITVSRSDFVFHSRTIRLEPGVQRFVVPTRSSLKGRVQIRGQVPREPVGIALVGGEGSRPYRFIYLRSTSDSQGNVEFFNLPADWTGTLNPPKGYRRNERPFITTGVSPTNFATLGGCAAMNYSRPHYDDGQPHITGVLTPLPTININAIASPNSLGVPAGIDVGTFLNPVSTDTGTLKDGEPPFDKPGITIVYVEPANVPEFCEFGVHDAGIINLIPMREIKFRIVSGSKAGGTDLSAGVYIGPNCWFAVPGSTASTLWIDDDKTSGDLRESLRVLVPSSAPNSWFRVDGQRVFMTESGNDEITVTVHDSFPVGVLDTSPVGVPVTVDVTSDQ